MFDDVRSGGSDSDGDSDGNDFKPRPPWMKFFYMHWYSATSTWDDDQRGWYIQLVVWAATQGEPPGYLPDDDEELRELAGVKNLSTDVQTLIKLGVSISPDILDKIQESRVRRWSKVCKKFRKSQDYKGYLFNGRLLNCIKDAYRDWANKVHAGKMSAAKRISKQLKINKLSTAVRTAAQQPFEHATSTSSSLSALDLESGGTSLTTHTDQDTEYKDSEEIKKQEKTKDQVSVTKEKKSRSLPETMFDESKFTISEKMFSHLTEKYPDFERGDFDWLRDKFCNVYYGKRQRSWARSFYNFVGNELVKWDYHPGDYKKLKGNGRDETKRQSKFESSGERNARLSREAVEHIAKRERELQNRSAEAAAKNQTWLPVTTDDD